MKKHILLLVALCAIFVVNSQVTVGTGTSNNQQIPIDPSNEYSYSQVIYSAEEINASGAINGITLYKAGIDLTNSNDWVVSIGHTTLSSFTSESDWVLENTLTEVFNGTVIQSINGSVEIVFSTSFLYNGIDNLVISFDENTAGSGSLNDDFYCTASSYANSLVYTDNSGTNPDPMNPPVATAAFGGLKYAKPNITFNGLSQTCQASFSDIYSQQFATYLPNCWTEMEGVLSANTSFTSTTDSDWSDTNFGNTGSNKCARFSMSWYIHKDWLVSPSFDLGTTINHQLEFDLAMTQPGNTNSAIFDADDIFAIVISTDNGATWSNANILRSWTAGDNISNTGEHIVLDLSSYTGEIKIGYYCGSTVSVNSKMVQVDNYLISASETCPPPINLVFSNITSTDVDLGWDAGGATNVQIEYGTTDFELGTGISVLGTSNSHTLNGLSAAHMYDIYMRDICAVGDTSNWILAPVLSPACPTSFTPTYSQDFTNYLPNCWTEMQGVLAATTTITNATSSTWDMDGFAANGLTGSARMPYTNTISNEWLISPSIDLGTTVDYQVEFDLAYSDWGNNGLIDMPATDKFVVVISTDDGVTWSDANALQTWTTGLEPDNNGEFIVIDLSSYTGVVKIGFYCQRTSSSFASRRLSVDNFNVQPLTTCSKPSTVTITNIIYTNADVSWPLGGAANVEIEYGPAGFIPGTGQGSVIITSSNPYNLTGLSELTDYDVYLRDICAVGDTSDYTMPVGITTPCAIITPTYIEDFTTWQPACWTKMMGRLGAVNTDFISPDNSSWYSAVFGAVGNKAARVSITSNTRQEWLISPSIDLGTGNNYELTFDIALTSTSGTAANFGSDDSLAVVISTDNGATWNQANILQVWEDNAEPSHTGDFITIDLSAYTGAVKIGFYAASSVSNATNYAYLDNFRIGPPLTCFQPTGVTVSNEATNSAEVAWSTGGASSVLIEYGPSGFLPGNGIGISTVTSSNPFTLTNLLSLTDYDVYVKDICAVGDTSYNSTIVTFTTTCGIYSPTYTQDFLEFVPTCWSEMQGVLGATGTTVTNATISNWHWDAIGNITSLGGAGCHISSSVKEWLISPSIDLGTGTPYQLEFIVSSTGNGNTNPAAFDANDSLAIVISTDNGVTWQQTNVLKVWTGSNSPLSTGEYIVIDLSSYTGVVKFGFYAGSPSGSVTNEVQLDDFRILPLESCLTPIDIEVISTTDVSVDLSWTAGSTTSQIEYGPSGFTPGTGTLVVGLTNPLTISGLSDNTNYDFYMRSICAVGDTSGWSMVTTFTTLCPTYTPPYYNDMAINYCWTEMSAVLGATTSNIWNNTTSSWTSGWYGNVSGASLSSRVSLSNVPFGNTNNWLVTPSFDLGIGNAYNLEFDINFTLSGAGGAGGAPLQADDTIAVVISTDNGVTWAQTNILDVWNLQNQPSNSSNQHISLDLSAYSGNVKFGFYATSTVTNPTTVIVSIDNFEIADCGAPINNTIDAISSTTADISWTLQTANSMVEYGIEGFTPGTGTIINSTTGTVQLTGLTSTTSYDYYIQNDCGVGGLSNWSGPFTFATPCPEYIPTYIEDFSTYLPYCWEEKEGALGTLNTTFTNNYSTAWTDDGFGNVGFIGAAKINFSGTGGDEWLISPTIDLGNGSIPYQVQFDVALTTYANTDSDLLDPDDSLVFIISVDNGLTWNSSNILKSFTAGSEPSNLGDLIINELQAYTGLVKFGFYMATSVAGGNANMYIDNFSVKPIPSCQQPLNVSIDDITNTTVDINWTAGATYSFIEYGPLGFIPGTGVGTSILATLGPEQISSLLANTNYDIYVMDSCAIGDVSDWSGPINFTTECEVIIPDHLEIFSTVLPDCWSHFQGPLGSNSTLVTNPFSSSWTEDGFGNVTSIGAAKLNIYSPSSNGDRFDWLVSPSIDLGDGTIDYILEFDLASTYYYNTTDADFDSDDSLAVLISTDDGATWSSNNILQTWTEGDEPSNTGDHINISLWGYTGIVKLAYYGSTTGYGGNVNVYVDNFEIKTCTPSSSSITEFACDSYTSPSGISHTSSGIFNDTIVNAMGCDSVITIDLTFELNSSNSINASACNEYISDAGNSYFLSGNYTESFTNAAGCDSILNLNLSIITTNLNITQINGNQLTANASGGGVQYQWVDCDDGNAPIAGATNSTYIATSNGNYACELTKGNCVSLTDCYAVNNIGINETNKLIFAVYPNPTSDQLTVELISNQESSNVIITDMDGKVVYSTVMNVDKHAIDVSHLSSGIYVITVNSEFGSSRLLFSVE